LLASVLILGSAPFASAQPTIRFNIGSVTYGLNGVYPGTTVFVTNVWIEAQSVVVYATFRSGTAIYVEDGTATISSNATVSVFLINIIPIPPGLYSVTFAAITLSDEAVSAPTTPISILVPP